jgi:hypothetical protein
MTWVLGFYPLDYVSSAFRHWMKWTPKFRPLDEVRRPVALCRRGHPLEFCPVDTRRTGSGPLDAAAPRVLPEVVLSSIADDESRGGVGPKSSGDDEFRGRAGPKSSGDDEFRGRAGPKLGGYDEFPAESARSYAETASERRGRAEVKRRRRVPQRGRAETTRKPQVLRPDPPPTR